MGAHLNSDAVDAFGYTFGSAGTSSTYRDNLKAFKRYKIVPRMLVNATVRSLEVGNNSGVHLSQNLNVSVSEHVRILQTTIFGVKLPSPMIIAPVGVQGIMHPDAELATARAARNLGVPFVMSTASTRSIEEVAEANGDGHRWYQLYW
jgi:lactate 2-monooxygenase